MIIEQAEKTELRQYLLGRLSDEGEERVEMRLLTDPDFAEQFDIAVNELTDEYVAGEIKNEERDRVEKYFFKSADRRTKLKHALALDAYRSQFAPRRNWWASPELRVAASLLIVVGVAFAVWRGFRSESELDKGMLALRAAYREQRPIESRISALPHSPFSQTRGAESTDSAKDDLRRGELHLIQAVKDNPSAAAHHALGQLYLAEQQFDLALKEFEAALKDDPNNPRLYNDMGVVWFEKAKRLRESGNSSQTQDAFNRSVENFNKALQLDGNLLDAIFNRALSYERQSRTEDAKAEWRNYLSRDSSSPWAAEARRHLAVLEP